MMGKGILIGRIVCSELWDLTDTRPKFGEMRQGVYYLPELCHLLAVQFSFVAAVNLTRTTNIKSIPASRTAGEFREIMLIKHSARSWHAVNANQWQLLLGVGGGGGLSIGENQRRNRDRIHVLGWSGSGVRKEGDSKAARVQREGPSD